MIHAEAAFGKGFLTQLGEEIAAKNIRSQVHPGGLTIYNYTEQAVYQGRWNRATRNARGLILDHQGRVIARPFAKFHNYGEAHAIEVQPDDLVLPYDKLDGSLGIMYMAPDGYPAIATRGSFTSDQAVHATRVLRERYLQWAAWVTESHPLQTQLFEIIYPENRIVVDYEGLDDLVFLGSVMKTDGMFFGPDNVYWEGPKAQEFGVMTFTEALSMPDREGKEGMVLYHFLTGDRVKIKQADYVRLHRIVTNLNERAVWEVLKDGSQDTDTWIAQLPDEFHAWSTAVADSLRHQFRQLSDYIDDEFAGIVDSLGLNDGGPLGTWLKDSRKDFADRAKTARYPWAMFAKLDGKNYSQRIWDLIRPEANQGPHGVK